MSLKAGINDITYLDIESYFVSPLGFEVLKTFLLTIPEDLNTNRSDCKTFWKKTVGVSGIYIILETVWEC